MTVKSYQHINNPQLAAAKKTGMKREHSPSNPYKRKARGKENNPGANSTGLFACERVRGRVGIRKRLIEAAVEDALKAFCGTRGNPGDACDQNLWALFAWKFGWGLLRELTLQGEAEMRERKRPIKDGDKPKVLQRLIAPFWKRGKQQAYNSKGSGKGRREEQQAYDSKGSDKEQRGKQQAYDSKGSGKTGDVK